MGFWLALGPAKPHVGLGWMGRRTQDQGNSFPSLVSTTLGAGVNPLDAGAPFFHYPGEVGEMAIFLPPEGPGSPALGRTLQTCPGLPAVPLMPPWSPNGRRMLGLVLCSTAEARGYLCRGHSQPGMAQRSPRFPVPASSEVPGLLWRQPCYFLFVPSNK